MLSKGKLILNAFAVSVIWMVLVYGEIWAGKEHSPLFPFLRSERYWGERKGTVSLQSDLCRTGNVEVGCSFPAVPKFSPRATTTNQPTNRAPNEAARPGPK